MNRLTQAGDACPLLSAHRSYVRANNLGYGEPAFDAMWASLLVAAAKRFGKIRVLEIGVYKGQLLALWAKLAEELNIEIEVSAISPLEGNPRPWGGRLIQRIRRKISRSYREQDDVGNFHPDEDYEGCIRSFFHIINSILISSSFIVAIRQIPELSKACAIRNMKSFSSTVTTVKLGHATISKPMGQR
ncbi:hypothetical protein [Cephaloticoccus primus]|uniref:hypothetical protein n=1 Tax=Cephaloticoccus primus TaxID=1548207 RepID=UPI001E455FDE|nr:hypothetical protein [Cephaloticoccus primus]